MRPAAVVFAALAAAASAAANAQAPPGYYASVVTTSPQALRASLHQVVDDHVRVPYTAAAPDTWDVLELADENPANPAQILDVYKNATYAKQGGGNPFYNREHTWPSSYGFPVDGPTNYPFSDCHQLFLCDVAYNTARDRKPFATGSASWTRLATLANAGAGGVSGPYPSDSNWTAGTAATGGFEVWSAKKGDVARALFYLDVRYEGGVHGTTGASEPDLVLTDDLGLIAASFSSQNLSLAHMGRLTTLLQWHQQDPVDARERARNDVVFAFQGNRNPFVDHPEWVDCLWLGQCGAPSTGRAPELWINELPYDNAGFDFGEFVELAGPAGESVDGWMLVVYDGATGLAYGRRVLRGVLPDQQNGFGTLSVPFPGLRDDLAGVALVAQSGAVLQFLSAQSAFVAANVSAAGRNSVDIGVSEPPTNPVSSSLRLTGVGTAYASFAWQPPAANTAGAVNQGQSFP